MATWYRPIVTGSSHRRYARQKHVARKPELWLCIESVRPITPIALLAIVPSRIDVPSGPVKGIVTSIASILLVRDGDHWKIANFHNTRREATQSDHLAINEKPSKIKLLQDDESE